MMRQVPDVWKGSFLGHIWRCRHLASFPVNSVLFTGKTLGFVGKWWRSKAAVDELTGRSRSGAGRLNYCCSVRMSFQGIVAVIFGKCRQ